MGIRLLVVRTVCRTPESGNETVRRTSQSRARTFSAALSCAKICQIIERADFGLTTASGHLVRPI